MNGKSIWDFVAERRNRPYVSLLFRNGLDFCRMTEFGPLVQVETSAPPYGGTHMLFTDLKPQRDGYNAAHMFTVIDFYTPLFPDKTPELADAWRYMMTAPIDGE